MVARIGKWQGSGEDLERWVVRSQDQVKPAVAQQSGLEGALWLLDRDTGEALTITLWEDEEAMAASERFRQQTQSKTAEESGASVTTATYEVVDRV